MLGGAAGLAAPAVGAPEDDDPARAGDRGFAIMHGLFWLCSNLAARRPLLLVVDDAHWSDEPSLRWLAYFARRREDIPMLVVVAMRPREPGAPAALLDELRSDQHGRGARAGAR